MPNSISRRARSRSSAHFTKCQRDCDSSAPASIFTTDAERLLHLLQIAGHLHLGRVRLDHPANGVSMWAELGIGLLRILTNIGGQHPGELRLRGLAAKREPGSPWRASSDLL